jgi:hypothetical protein
MQYDLWCALRRFFLATLLLLLAPATSAATHQSMSRWLAFEYPDGWETVLTEQESRARYVENVGVQPKGQDFVGRDGQFALRVFDPLYVYDETGLPSTAQPEQIFRSFVRSLPGEAGARFAVESSGDSTNYVARGSVGDMQTYYRAKRAEDGFLMVVGGAASKNSASQLERLVQDMLRSMRFAAPSGTNMEPSKAVAQWYAALDKGDASTMRALTCARAKDLQDLIGFSNERAGNPDFAEALIRAAKTSDRSGLRFFPFEAQETAAAVRIAGPIRRGDGKVVPFYKSARAFGSNVLVVRKEAGAWKVCEPVRAKR